MRRLVTRRSFAVLGVLLATQLLTACVVVPVPYHRPRGAVIVQPRPYYYDGYRYHRHYDRYQDGQRDWGDHR